jgi:hypothetical protein
VLFPVYLSAILCLIHMGVKSSVYPAELEPVASNSTDILPWLRDAGLVLAAYPSNALTQQQTALVAQQARLQANVSTTVSKMDSTKALRLEGVGTGGVYGAPQTLPVPFALQVRMFADEGAFLSWYTSDSSTLWAAIQ